MERHTLPDSGAGGTGGAGPRSRHRRVLMATALVLTLAAGTGVAAYSGLPPFGRSCEESAVRLDVAVSPDIAPVVRAAADRVHKEKITSDGQCMDVRVKARENYQVATELSDHRSESEYEVWLPDSKIWAHQADASSRGVPLQMAGEVAVSPIGVATDRSAGSWLGWPGKTYTWAQLATATTASESVHLGTADPTHSATGLLALAGVAASYARESGDRTWEERNGTDRPLPDEPGTAPESTEPEPKEPASSPSAKRSAEPKPKPSATKGPKQPLPSPSPPREGAQSLPAEADRTPRPGLPDADARIAATARLLAQRLAPADSQILRTLSAPGSSRNEAVFLSEQAAFTHNFSAGDKDDLDLFYPTDRALRLDYPYHLVDVNDLTVDEGRAATRFGALLGDAASLRDLAAHGFRPPRGEAPGVLVHTAGGRPPQPYARQVTGADQISRDLLQEMLGMWTITVRSARLTTVVDVSGSMQSPVPGRSETRLEATKASLLRVVDQFSQEDEIGLWEFATGLNGPHDYRELVPTARLGALVRGERTQRTQLSAAFQALKPVPDGATGLYDSTLAAYKSAQAGHVPGKFNALIVVTDGANQDRFSISRSTLLAKLKEVRDDRRPVPLIAIAVGTSADQGELDKIAQVTGGAGYQVSDPADIQGAILKAITAVGRSLDVDRD
ncbi:substrate-binding domain-containing protein [Streptomyces sp. NBC_00690]|uniref:substrate-binding domain-containing protein n=1 Tax=Streptomyces sp. NBC_00690 TaxID=2975808 RepID=UPI002E2A9778|nr:VWA domain-containing protein [Streptomyces sp. NBC_00690]